MKVKEKVTTRGSLAKVCSPTAQAYIYYSTDFLKLRTSLLMNQHASAMLLMISTNSGNEAWEWSLPSWAGAAESDQAAVVRCQQRWEQRGGSGMCRI